MEFSTGSPLLDAFGQPLPDHIQHVLGDLKPRFRRKFSMIRDEVVVTDVLEEAGQRIVDHEATYGAVESLHGFAWVVLRNVAISTLRRPRHLLERSMAGWA